MAVTMKNGVFLRSVCRLLVTASVVPSSPILVTLMKEALSSSGTSVFTRATLRNSLEHTVLDEGHLSASRSGRFTTVETAPGTQWMEYWVGQKALVKRQSDHSRERNHECRTCSPSLYQLNNIVLYTDSEVCKMIPDSSTKVRSVPVQTLTLL
jgi:hypothetical protein